ncbi:hypothetical protein AAG747_17085 [Rapidithrix thailandica]|uniref:Photosystem I assembly protein Ycf4 n=1 Tax=Rapidithrix thailandica TaxID=413964 RepID=A0AAW9RXL4_9BACT
MQHFKLDLTKTILHRQLALKIFTFSITIVFLGMNIWEMWNILQNASPDFKTLFGLGFNIFIPAFIIVAYFVVPKLGNVFVVVDEEKIQFKLSRFKAPEIILWNNVEAIELLPSYASFTLKNGSRHSLEYVYMLDGDKSQLQDNLRKHSQQKHIKLA